MKILVINHIANEEFNIKRILDSHEIFIEENHDDIENIISREDIQLILMDLDSDPLKGFNLIRFLKTDKKYKNIPIIIFTCGEHLENEEKALALGADDHIRKPIIGEALLKRIDMYSCLFSLERIRRDLKNQNTFLNTIFNQTQIGIGILQTREDGQYSYIRVNDVFKKILGRTEKDLLKEDWQSFTHPEDKKRNLEEFKRIYSGETNSFVMEKRYIRPDGSIVWVRLIVSKLMLTKDNKLSYICLIQDITKEKLSEINFLESERSKKIILSHLPGLAYRCRNDKDWTMEYVSSGCLELTGYLPEALLYNKELSFNEIIAPDYREDIQRKWEYSIKNDLPFKYEYEIITAQGERKWVYETGQGVFNKGGELEYLEGIILDISEKKEVENNLRYISTHDTLTDLHNSSYFQKLLERELSDSSRQYKKALVGINLNPLQVLNLTYGFYYVRDLIKRIGHTLETLSSETHLLFRTHESRFLFYVKNYNNLSELIRFSETIRDTLEPIISLERIIGGIGIYEIKDNDVEIADILKKLLIASEKAMALDISKFLNISPYNDEMEKEIIREEGVKRELYNLLENKDGTKLLLEFQPILDLKSNKISGFEALARIVSRELGRIPPLEFIPLAEKTKLIIPIGKMIIRQALIFLDTIIKLGYDDIKISINISAIQLLEKDFVINIIKFIKEIEVAPENIILEITESTLV